MEVNKLVNILKDIEFYWCDYLKFLIYLFFLEN